jgi:hypothetical protein
VRHALVLREFKIQTNLPIIFQEPPSSKKNPGNNERKPRA